MTAKLSRGFRGRARRELNDGVDEELWLELLARRDND
jgi:hypothetical protein